MATTWAFGYINENYVDINCVDDEYYCYNYHQQHDHFYLDWLDILRIGNISIDLKSDEQLNVLILAF